MIDTALGRIGVGNCADNHRCTLLGHMRDRAVDLVLTPPRLASAGRNDQDRQRVRHPCATEKRASLPVIYARALGVPAVLVNHLGPMDRLGGVLGPTEA